MQLHHQRVAVHNRDPAPAHNTHALFQWQRGTRPTQGPGARGGLPSGGGLRAPAPKLERGQLTASGDSMTISRQVPMTGA